MKDGKMITNYCYKLGLEHDERPESNSIKKSIEIYNIGKYLLKKRRCASCGKIINRSVPGKKTIMASSIYIASILTCEHRYQETIAQSLNVSLAGLRKQYKKIMTLPEYSKNPSNYVF